MFNSWFEFKFLAELWWWYHLPVVCNMLVLQFKLELRMETALGKKLSLSLFALAGMAL